MIEMKITLQGRNMLLMHNERLANPTDPLARQMKTITAKRKKTDDDLEDVAKLEFEGGLYMADDGPVIPTWNIKKCFVEGGRISKLGKHIERAFHPVDQEVPLMYSGPRDVQGMWEAGLYDRRSAKVGTSKVMRCRPAFVGWSLVFSAMLDGEVIGIEEFALAASRAGAMVGLGDFRPRFGQFAVEVSV